MARRGQRVLLRRGMHQCLNIVAYRRQESHVPAARPYVQTRPPCSIGGSCQTPIKRTLRRHARTLRAAAAAQRFAAIHTAFVRNGERRVAANGCEISYAWRVKTFRETKRAVFRSMNAAMIACRVFVQSLAKLCFFKLLENLRCILFEYGPNPPFPANRPFKAPC